jgi:hypothetical protein
MEFVDNYRQLGCAVAIQAAKDYEKATPAQRRHIIKDLRSDYMETITDGLSVYLADALRNNHTAVIKRIKNMEIHVV